MKLISWISETLVERRTLASLHLIHTRIQQRQLSQHHLEPVGGIFSILISASITSLAIGAATVLP